MIIKCILFIVLGILLVLWGADRLTDGAVALARRMKVPQIVIGLTIVAMGTSMPEFCVSLVSALKGTPDLAVGNVVGSNIFNAMLIVGCAAMVAPMTILRTTVRKDIPFAVAASAIMFLECIDGEVSRADAALLCVVFLFFMFTTLKAARPAVSACGNVADDGAEERGNSHAGQQDVLADLSVVRSVVYLLFGLTGLIVGSNVFVDNATQVAYSLGISEAVVGLTIVAGGTSLPELATSIVAARKGNSGIAIGNVLGSNVFNILLIIGVTGVVCPMHISGITMLDLSVMTGSMLLLWLFSYTRFTVARWEGAVLTLLFLAYMGYLVAQVA